MYLLAWRWLKYWSCSTNKCAWATIVHEVWRNYLFNILNCWYFFFINQLTVENKWTYWLWIYKFPVGLSGQALEHYAWICIVFSHWVGSCRGSQININAFWIVFVRIHARRLRPYSFCWIWKLRDWLVLSVLTLVNHICLDTTSSLSSI